MAEFKKLNESELNPLAKKLGAKLLPKNFGQKKPRYVYEVYWYTDEDCSDDPIFKKFPSNKARQLWYEQHKNDPDKFGMEADLDGYNVNESLKESIKYGEGNYKVSWSPYSDNSKLYNQFQNDAKKFPSYLASTNKAYDPEGLNIEDNDEHIIFAGEPYECLDQLESIKTDAINTIKKEKDSPYKSIYIQDEGKNYISLYYPRAISKVTYYVVNNSISKSDEPLEEQPKLDTFDEQLKESKLKEDTIKQNGKWVNKGKEGTHGTFKTKKQADAQRKAMFAGGFKESKLSEGDLDRFSSETKDLAYKLMRLAKKDNQEIKFEDACELIDQSFNNEADNIEDFYARLNFDESLDEGKSLSNRKIDSIMKRNQRYLDWSKDREKEKNKQDDNHGSENKKKESKLTEAPDDLGFETDDEIEAKERAEFERRLAQRKADRDSAKQKELDRQEQERKDKEAKEQAKERGKELYDKFKNLKSYDDVFELLVPDSGKADTVAGELWRAISRLEYRFFNDGDKFYEGYGRETAGSSAVYLIDEFDDLFSDDLIDMVGVDDNDYERYIEHLKEVAFNFLESNPDLFGTVNEHDSRSSKEYNIDKVDDFAEPRDYDYTVNVRKYYNDDLDIYLWDYLANEIIDSYDFIDRLKEDVDAELHGNSECEVDNPWGHYDEEYTITNLTKDEYDTLDDFLDRQDYFDSYIEELYNEYGDPNDREDDEEVEESLNENKSDYKTLREIISLFKQYAPDDFVNEFGNEENALDILKDNLYGDEYLGYNIVDLLNEIIDFGTREEKEKASRLLKVVKLHKGKRG